MIVDSSAIIAIVIEEPGSELYLEPLLASPARRVSAATLLEAAIIVDRHPSPLAAPKFDQLIARLRFVVEPVTASQVAIARRAYQRFGKGSGHPAKLNFGDCFAYALAKEFDEPLLFVGQDFVHTDISSVSAITVQTQSTSSLTDTLRQVEPQERESMTPELDSKEEEHINHCTPEMQDWYYDLRNFILGLGDDIEIHPYRTYTAFRRRITFAYVNCRPARSPAYRGGGHRIAIDIRRPAGEVAFDNEFLFLLTAKPGTFREKLVQISVNSTEDVERARSFIEESYRSSG